MTDGRAAAGNRGVDEGRPGDLNAGLGQKRVGEDGAGPLQDPPFPPAAGGPGSGSGDDRAFGDRASPRPRQESTVEGGG